jgi:PAS domain S-box-containing protein
MEKRNSKSNASKLRQKAEEKLEGQESNATSVHSEEAIQRIIHELEVHQVELEMQQDELILSNENAQIISKKYTQLFDYAPNGNVVLSMEGNIINLNFWVAKKLGKDRLNLTGSRFAFFISEKTRPVFTAFMDSLYLNYDIQICEVVLEIEGSEDVNIQIEGRYLKDTDQFVLSLIDVTEIKEVLKNLELANEELNNASQQQNSILNALPSSITLINNNGEIIAVNNSWVQFGNENNLKSSNHCIGDNYIDISNKSTGDEAETGKKTAKGIKQVINGVLPYFQLEYPCLSINGPQWFRVDVNPIIKEQGHGAVIMHTNITESKKAEQVLKESEERWKFALEGNSDGVWDWNIITNDVFFSEQWKNMLGFSNDEITGSLEEWDKRIHPDDKQDVYEAVNAHMRGETTSYHNEHRVLCKDNSYKWVLARGKILSFTPDKKPARMIGTHSDITNRKQAEANLIQAKEKAEESEERYRALVDATPQAICVHQNDKIVYVNPAAVKVFKANTVKDLFHKPIFDLIHPEYQNLVLERMETLINIGDTNDVFEIKLIRLDGTIIDIETQAILINYNGKPYIQTFIRDITAKKEVEAELEKYQNNLETLVKTRTAELLIKNSDLTIEKLKVEEINKELEAFSYSVSHDLRAPLRHIDGFTTLMLKSSNNKLGEKEKIYLKNIIDSSLKMNQLIDGLLIYSRMGRAQLKRVSINMKKIVDKVIQTFVLDIKKNNISITIDELPNAYTDVFLITQVWQNLIDNAIKFSSKTKNPEIHISFYKDKQDNTIFFIKDNGVGFDSNFAKKAFGVFQRLHTIKEFPGTGIGLATAKRIIIKHGGDIWGESQINKGATFFFKVPSI